MGEAAIRKEAFPFPFGEDGTEWWVQLHPVKQKRWAPLLRLMSPEERKEFHAYRRKKRETFWAPEGTQARINEQEEAEDRLHMAWTVRLEGRA